MLYGLHNWWEEWMRNCSNNDRRLWGHDRSTCGCKLEGQMDLFFAWIEKVQGSCWNNLSTWARDRLVDCIIGKRRVHEELLQIGAAYPCTRVIYRQKLFIRGNKEELVGEMLWMDRRAHGGCWKCSPLGWASGYVEEVANALVVVLAIDKSQMEENVTLPIMISRED